MCFAAFVHAWNGLVAIKENASVKNESKELAGQMRQSHIQALMTTCGCSVSRRTLTVVSCSAKATAASQDGKQGTAFNYANSQKEGNRQPKPLHLIKQTPGEVA